VLLLASALLLPPAPVLSPVSVSVEDDASL